MQPETQFKGIKKKISFLCWFALGPPLMSLSSQRGYVFHKYFQKYLKDETANHILFFVCLGNSHIGMYNLF